MNMSKVINDIKLANGLNTIALPFDKPVELVIREILEGTIRTFSHFKPWRREGTYAMNTLRSPDDYSKRQGIYFLPEDMTITEVRDATAYLGSSIESEYGHSINTFTVGTPFVGFGSYYPQDIINATATGAAINKYTGITAAVPTSEWKGFNKIQLFNFPKNSNVHFIVNCNHDPSGETIEESLVESFMKLATLDVRRTLYAQLKNMVGVGSAFKETQLKIDDWSGADSAYWELLDKWEGVFHLDEIEELVQFF